MTIGLLNGIFLVCALGSTLLLRDRIGSRIVDAFESGDLGDLDYLPFDSRRGFHQFNDCNILQMAWNADDSVLGQALGPWLYYEDIRFEACCRTLRQLVTGEVSASDLESHRYTRYWHGYLPVSALALSAMDLGALRRLLQGATFLAGFAVLIAALLRDRRLLPFAVPLSAFALFLWGLPYFGQGLSHGFGDAAVLLGIAGLLMLRTTANRRFLTIYCTAFGCVVAYFAMLTGPLPVAFGLLFPVVFLKNRLEPGGSAASESLSVAAHAQVAFACGAVGTVFAHLLLVAVLVRPHHLELFFGNLLLYSGRVGETAIDPLTAAYRLLRRGAVLTYGSKAALIVLYVGTACAWAGAAVLAVRSRDRASRLELVVFGLGASTVPAWILALPTHTSMHAGFMSRILIVPIVLGWAALLRQLALSRSRPRCRERDRLPVEPVRNS